jgi:hypothetical protein
VFRASWDLATNSAMLGGDVALGISSDTLPESGVSLGVGLALAALGVSRRRA